MYPNINFYNTPNETIPMIFNQLTKISIKEEQNNKNYCVTNS